VSGLRCAVAGANGLVGSALLRRLLEDPLVARVVAPTRRPLPPHAKLENPALSGAQWPDLAPLDEAFSALGTTRAKAGSPEAFRAVDLDLNAAFARAARKAGARGFGLVSSLGANADSAFLYPRTKGEVENVLRGLGFETLVIARPSFLLGPRAEARAGESAALRAATLLGPVLPARWRAVPGAAVARALIASVRGRVPGTLVLESDRLA
jgi:uncharacterized protein YbjT (DUF2867 family)